MERRWISIYITYFGSFSTFIQMSIYWTSLWPYLTQIDPSTSPIFFGIILAAYSGGSVVAAPCFGFWSSRSKTTKHPIILGFLLNICGNLIMAFIEPIPIPVNRRRFLILAARIISGLGAGNFGVAQAFLAHASTLEERNSVMAYQASVMSSVVLLGPGFAAALSPIGYPGWAAGPIRIDMYTLEAWVCILLSTISLLLYLFVYQECDVSADEVASLTVNDSVNRESSIKSSYGSLDIDANADFDSSKATSELPGKSKLKEGLATDKSSEDAPTPVEKVNVPAAISCVAVRFVMIFCIAYNDTIGPPLTMIMFLWTSEEAVLYNGIILTVCGVQDFIGNIFVGKVLLKYVSERSTMLAGTCSFIMFFLLTFPWPGLPLLIDSTVASSENSTSPSNMFLNAPIQNDTSCNYTWCRYTTRIGLPTYLVGFVFLFLAFCLAYVPASTLFSKVIGPQHQGFLQGLFASAQSLGSMIGPLVVGALFQTAGPRVCWEVAMAILSSCLLLLVVNYRKLVPPNEI